tara:strand:+ start:2209 stop:2790 length:582 start_codon:yes stop_codon:yes gene_type:complete
MDLTLQQYPESDHLSDLDMYDDEEQNYNDYSQSEFIDDEPSYVDEDENSQDSSVSFIMVGKKKQIKKKKKSKQKTQDTGIRKLKTKDGNLVYFATNPIPGSSIRDAIYGTYMHEDKVGTTDEDLYFKVMYAGVGCKSEVDKLYYDNPEQFENHMNVSLNEKTKSVWAEKYQIALKRRQLQQEKSEFVNNIKIK